VFECYRKVEKPKARLVCFPYLGGEPSVFRGWTAFVPADVELYAYVPQRSSTWEDLLPLILDQLALLDQAAPGTHFLTTRHAHTHTHTRHAHTELTHCLVCAMQLRWCSTVIRWAA